jgi:hypothetical protein
MGREAGMVRNDPRYSQGMRNFIRRLAEKVSCLADWPHRQERRRWRKEFNAQQARELSDRDVVYYALGLGNSPEFQRACQAEAGRRGLELPYA